MKVGFIGLGTMGLPMAANLTRGGHDVIGHDADASVRPRAEAAGLRWAETIGEATRAADVVITMLPNGAVVQKVALGPGGVAETMRSDALFVDMSTIAPDETDRLTEGFSARNLAKVDAPVARSSKEAVEGKLLVMAGGRDADITRARPLFELMADTIMPCGPAAGRG